MAPTSGLNFLLFLEGDYDAFWPPSIPSLSKDIVESVNRILKVGYKDHTAHGGRGKACSRKQPRTQSHCGCIRVGVVVLQFDLLVTTRGIPTHQPVFDANPNRACCPPPPLPRPPTPSRNTLSASARIFACKKMEPASGGESSPNGPNDL